MALKLLKHVQICGTITCKTGLRIGGGKGEMEIGGMDNPILRHPLTKEPYIPGSSLKGKMRSLLEYKLGKINLQTGEPCGCAECMVCKVFGPHKKSEHTLGPTRIIVRDANLKKEWAEKLSQLQEEGLLFAEVKNENWIDRRTGVAGRGGLRTQERVPAGTQFELRISVRIFEGDNEKEILEFIKEGLRLLCKDYLGSSGTRGYGELEIALENDTL